ncbi:MAG: NAD-dependent epimerase/dehydratase family protein [Pseudomonadota bacterium]|mgnify:FL=1
MNVLVIGSASPLARALLPALLNDARIERVIGVDIRTGGFSHPRYRFRPVDVRAPELAVSLGEVDAVIHLGFAATGRRFGPFKLTRELMRDINVRGSQNAFTLAAEQGVKHVILLSSAAVYGLDGLHRGSFTENHPRRPLSGFSYAEDKIVVEGWLDEFEQTHPELRVVRLRPHVIFGAHVNHYAKKLLRLPFYPRLPEPQPLTQCVHEDDVVQAILLTLFGNVRGAFNLATANAIPFRDLQRQLHRRLVPVPLWPAKLLIGLGSRLFGFNTGASWMESLRYNFALHSGRARRELGWKPRYDTVGECLQAFNTGTHGQDNKV